MFKEAMIHVFIVHCLVCLLEWRCKLVYHVNIRLV